MTEKPVGKRDGDVLGIRIIVPDNYQDTRAPEEEWLQDWLDAEDGQFCIQPENWPAFQVWMGLETQWEMVGSMSGAMYVGIPVERIDRVLARANLGEAEAGVYADIRAMERVAKKYLNESLLKSKGKA